ncbi:MAG: NAD-dependent epimerase/dehydratase family protein [Alphaproteobacteria bacterium]
MTQRHIFITGGAGYIGSVLTPMLLEAGYRVTVLDTFPSGNTYLADCCHYEGFTPIRGDTRDERLLKEWLPKADVVLPLAALVGAPLCDRDPYNAIAVNRDAVLKILKLLGTGQHLVFPNSNSGYGTSDPNAACTEESPLKPISLYGRTKVEAEEAILSANKGVSLRLATVFGVSPRMRLDLLVNDFTYRAVRDHFIVVFEGHFKRNYIHIRDVAKAFMYAIAHYDKMKGEPYNIGLSSANLSKIELCQLIQSIVPDFVYLEAPFGEDPDKRNYIVSNAKIEATGYRPDWTLETGIRELTKAYAMIDISKFSNV